MSDVKAAEGGMRVLVVDDEPLARDNVRHLLAREPDVSAIRECEGGQEAVALILREPPDLVFLDVQMPELDGFGVLREVGPERMPPVVFVTAFDRYAVRAFEVNALDYLLKPFSDARFQEALGRARKQRATGKDRGMLERLSALLSDYRPLAAEPPPIALSGGYLERIAVKTDGKVLLIPVADLDWCEAEGNYVVLHAGGKSPMLRETLNRVEQLLDPKCFVRVHRSTLVNVNRIRELEPDVDKGWVVVLRDGTRLRLSPGRKSAVEALLRQSF
ncbi:DNA-binding response regulator [Myxococcus stipitatus DSM 14675]|uniref:DNA-binding response regulator n=1 Tax=Myxococcus stipitatus (strain DSM 14675 / JCM 12634 / Mx s8) TaxID=1278073 RepID=L7UBT4_MYXSD|nr:LytTR family DNA-binding domain-containing protein [Myxococcus stipitatus]AGC45355.1 DNA-binding response regulator [Myxococcus stipitatus DSM 14675]